ncbi:MAG: hypothetical protein ACR2FS_15880 [Phormidesmis sp.]
MRPSGLSPPYVATISCSGKGLFSGELGTYPFLQAAQSAVEEWLLRNKQIGIYTEIHEGTARSQIVPIRPRAA